MTRKTRPVSWIKGALKEFERFPEGAKSICLAALTITAEGGNADVADPMHGMGPGVFEIALPFRATRSGWSTRCNSRRKSGLSMRSEEIDTGHQDAQARGRSDQRPLEKAEGDVAMKDEKLDVVRGSGNVFRDLGHKNADGEQLKAILAAEIVKALDREGLSVRAAHDRTGISAADFSRIRNANLGRFTVDHLMSILNRLGSRVEVRVRVRRAERVDLRPGIAVAPHRRVAAP
jgi:predicted XRE-type DNA-binding protein